MAFSRLGRSAVKSARSQIESVSFLDGNAVRSSLSGTAKGSLCKKDGGGESDIPRSNLTAGGAGKASVPRSLLQEWNYLYANLRFFSAEIPEKKNVFGGSLFKNSAGNRVLEDIRFIRFLSIIWAGHWSLVEKMIGNGTEPD